MIIYYMWLLILTAFSGELCDPWASCFFFSSPELKAQVSFSDQNLSVVVVAVVVVVNFSYFHLLLQNRWANFYQTWHKASLGKGDSSLFR